MKLQIVAESYSETAIARQRHAAMGIAIAVIRVAPSGAVMAARYRRAFWRDLSRPLWFLSWWGFPSNAIISGVAPGEKGFRAPAAALSILPERACNSRFSRDS